MDSTKLKKDLTKLVAQAKTLLGLTGSMTKSLLWQPPLAWQPSIYSVTTAMDLLATSTTFKSKTSVHFFKMVSLNIVIKSSGVTTINCMVDMAMVLTISGCLLEMAMTNFTSEIIGMVSMVMVDTVMTKSTRQVMS